MGLLVLRKGKHGRATDVAEEDEEEKEEPGVRE
jgi:hypothetical protein